MVVKVISNFINKLTGKSEKAKVIKQDETPVSEAPLEVVDPQKEMIKRQEILYKQLNNNLSDSDKQKLLSSIGSLSNVLKPDGPAASNKNKHSGLNR